jgi:hypothetical protein
MALDNDTKKFFQNKCINIHGVIPNLISSWSLLNSLPISHVGPTFVLLTNHEVGGLATLVMGIIKVRRCR